MSYNVVWRERTTEDIFNSFSYADWLKIFSDIYSQKDLEAFLSKKLGECWVAYDSKKNAPVAFIHMHFVGKKDNAVIHGGGWSGNPTINYICLLTFLNRLFSKGYGVRTSCLSDNPTAFRFLHSVGFVKYRTADGYDYLWLDEKRFRNTKVYNRFLK